MPPTPLPSRWTLTRGQWWLARDDHSLLVNGGRWEVRGLLTGAPIARGSARNPTAAKQAALDWSASHRPLGTINDRANPDAR